MNPTKILNEKRSNEIKNINEVSRRKSIRNSEQRNRSEMREKELKKEQRLSKQRGSQKKKQNTIDINTLIQNQKYKNQRLIVDEDKKNQLWRVVETRIRESQS